MFVSTNFHKSLRIVPSVWLRHNKHLSSSLIGVYALKVYFNLDNFVTPNFPFPKHEILFFVDVTIFLLLLYTTVEANHKMYNSIIRIQFSIKI